MKKKVAATIIMLMLAVPARAGFRDTYVDGKLFIPGHEQEEQYHWWMYSRWIIEANARYDFNEWLGLQLNFDLRLGSDGGDNYGYDHRQGDDYKIYRWGYNTRLRGIVMPVPDLELYTELGWQKGTHDVFLNGDQSWNFKTLSVGFRWYWKR